MKDLEEQLRGALLRLEMSAKKIVETRGYGKDAARLRMLAEMIKEQLKNENIGTTARSVR